MLTRRMQVQALADRLDGRQAPYTCEDFSGIIRACWMVLDTLPPDKAPTAIDALLANNPERMELYRQLQQCRPGVRIGSLPSLAELSASLRKIEWVWDGWIPRGMITLLGAVPGSGKSLLALDLARRIIHAGEFPDGSPVHNPGAPVLYVDAEVTPQLIHQRARAWGMDMKRLFLKLPAHGSWFDFYNLQQREQLIEEVDHLKPELLIIDAFANITSRGENDIEEVRGLLMFLNQLALDFNIALLIIHHMRKLNPRFRQLRIHMDDIRGSGHIIAMARSVLGLSVLASSDSSSRNGPRRLEVIKTNLGAYPPPLGFNLVPLEPEGVALEWGVDPHPRREPTLRSRCKDWLVELLQSSPQPVKAAEVIRLGELQGFSERLVYRCRLEMEENIGNSLGRQNPNNAWFWVDEPVQDKPHPSR